MFNPKVIQVIRNYDLRGEGVDDNPYRRIVQYLDFDGKVLAEEVDEYATPKKELAKQTDNSESDAIALLDEADTILSVINPDCQWRQDYKKYIAQQQPFYKRR